MPQKQLRELFAASAATERFKRAVLEFEAGRRTPLIEDARGNPPIKVLRLISYLLEQQPELAIESIRIEARSGCSDFVGTALVEPGGLRVDFKWDCAWRARREGWTDFTGAPDQIRAAREFGYDCFEQFELRAVV